MAEINSNSTEGDYCIKVGAAYEGLDGWREKYYFGDLFFQGPHDQLHRTQVNRHTLKFRKKYFLVPDDAVRDAAAKAAEYKRLLPALTLYREYLRQTGQRYELLREADRTLPCLPKLPEG